MKSLWMTTKCHRERQATLPSLRPAILRCDILYICLFQYPFQGIRSKFLNIKCVLAMCPCVHSALAASCFILLKGSGRIAKGNGAASRSSYKLPPHDLCGAHEKARSSPRNYVTSPSSTRKICPGSDFFQHIHGNLPVVRHINGEKPHSSQCIRDGHPLHSLMIQLIICRLRQNESGPG